MALDISVYINLWPLSLKIPMTTFKNEHQSWKKLQVVIAAIYTFPTTHCSFQAAAAETQYLTNPTVFIIGV